MKRTTISITVVGLLLGLIAAGMFLPGGRTAGGAGLVTPVRAQEAEQGAARAEVFERRRVRRCGPGAISGDFAYQASGTITQPIPQLQIPAGPFAVNSLLTLNNGTFSFKGTQSFNGTLVPAVGAGTYTVNEDCTGSGMDTSGIPYNFVVADGGNEIRIILAAPNTVVSGVARRL